jgi:nucleoid-associated protein YgaU
MSGDGDWTAAKPAATEGASAPQDAGAVVVRRTSPTLRTPPAPHDPLTLHQGRLTVTREHKLALIIGFSILLVVGVLVGDHFSKARTDRVNPALLGADPATGLQPDLPPSNSAPPPRAPMAAGLPSGGVGGGAEVPGAPGSGSGSMPPPTPMAIEMGAPVGTPSSPEGGLAIDGSPVIPSATILAGPSEPLPSPVVVVPPTIAPSPAMAPEPGRTSPIPGFVPVPETSPATPGPTSPAQATLPVSAGRLISHPVRPGDTLYRLAQQYYGDAKLWEPLAEYNRRLLGPGNRLSVGVTLRIPPRDVLLGRARLGEQGSPITAPATGPGATPAAPSSSPSPTTAPGRGAPAALARTAVAQAPATTEYVVQRGDTLGTISQKMLGTSRRWREILELNRSVIRDENALTVGTRLRLPAASPSGPAPATGSTGGAGRR